jgi:enoyl-CoA hydratase/carnithine racemase
VAVVSTAERSDAGVGVGVGTVHRTDDAGVATLTLERGVRNALSPAFADRLGRTLADCDADPSVRAVVLTGAGGSFCVGADLTGGPEVLRDLIADDGGYTNPDYREPAGRVTLTMLELGVPVIVAINGDAVGGGATVTLAADVRFAADTARFAFPFTRLGVCPEGGATYLLPRLVGRSRAAEWLISGRLVAADEALAAGLVSRLLPADQVLTAAQRFARELVDRTAPAAVAATRALLNTWPGDPVAASNAESRMIAELAATRDCLEGVGAFQQRRPPRFADRQVPGPSR